MKPSAWLSEIEFKNNLKIQLSKSDIVVFVGPNNAGKSASLKEITALLGPKQIKFVIFKDRSIEQEGNAEEVIAFLETNSIKDGSNGQYVGLGFRIEPQLISHFWNDIKKSGLRDLYPVFVNMLGTEERLKAANPANNIKLITQPFSHPIHFLQKYDETEKKFNNYFRQAFGTDLIVHRNAGKEVPLYVGERPVLGKDEDRISQSYLGKIEQLDLLHEQGDGMRSFVGVLLSAFVSDYSVLLIDEPEAFLHPPQARLLGKMLAKDLPPQTQLFLATHSEDFLKGLLDADSARLKIIRIQRDGKVNKISVLNNSDLKDIWSDPILRHSSVLNGLFHSKVIICESDSDCRFYSAIVSSIYENVNSISPDMLFIHCGGKHRIPTIVKSLKKLDVDVRVITDFDVLNEENPLNLIYTELGGIWKEIEADWKLVKTSIDQKRPELQTDELKKGIDAIFSSTEERIFSKNKISDVEKLLVKASPWAHAKETGKSFIPSGDATKAYERLQINLIEMGLHVVEIGQLESFDKSVGNHGPKWVNEVLKKDLISDPHLETARQFMKQVTS